MQPAAAAAAVVYKKRDQLQIAGPNDGRRFLRKNLLISVKPYCSLIEVSGFWFPVTACPNYHQHGGLKGGVSFGFDAAWRPIFILQ